MIDIVNTHAAMYALWHSLFETSLSEAKLYNDNVWPMHLLNSFEFIFMLSCVVI